MEKSNLIPFLRKKLDILFIGLNPAKGSSENRHYFSVNQAFWNQLFDAGLITKEINKSKADERIFGDNNLNYKNWNYGITDLIPYIAESNSSKIKPTDEDLARLVQNIILYKPKTVVLLHGKVLDKFKNGEKTNTGKIGKLIKNCDTMFFNIAFPHGNAINSERKVERYIELREYIENNKI